MWNLKSYRRDLTEGARMMDQLTWQKESVRNDPFRTTTFGKIWFSEYKAAEQNGNCLTRWYWMLDVFSKDPKDLREAFRWTEIRQLNLCTLSMETFSDALKLSWTERTQCGIWCNAATKENPTECQPEWLWQPFIEIRIRTIREVCQTVIVQIAKSRFSCRFEHRPGRKAGISHSKVQMDTHLHIKQKMPGSSWWTTFG